MHEHPLLGKQGLGLLHCLADDLSPRPDAVRPQFELVPGRARTASFLLAAVLLLKALARHLKVDAKERRTDQRQNNGGSDGSENVGDGVGHRHRIQCFLGFLGR